ncbi:MAG: thiamine pyrophosphate-binding protein [Dehalococcoidia bacterium]|nr:thiamine pyrophosphate-binding protein [Dehalococcoidia bacterium]
MPQMTGKRAFMEMLRAEGVKYIFGNPGTSEGAILDALEDYPDIEYILTTQEGAAMGMADAYARSTQQPAFVSLHIETGLANGISLLHNAKEGGTPMVVTSANKDIRKLAEGRTQLDEMTRLFTKWSAEVTHPEQIPSVMRRAFTEAKTPPTGPVYIGFSANALDDEGEVEIVPSPPGYFKMAPDAEAISDASELLSGASNPVMIVGDRLAQSGGIEEAVRVAELLGARVYSSAYSEMNFPTDHPQFMGRSAPISPAGRELFADADVVLAVGTNVFSGFFHFQGRALSQDTKLIHMDQAAREIGKSEPTDIGIISDPKVGLAHLADALDSDLTGAHREAAKGRAANLSEAKVAQQAATEARLKERWDLSPMSTERMMHEVAQALPPDTLIADDSVTTRDSIHAAIAFDTPGTVFGERGGALGWGMGGTLGLKLANPDRPVVGIIGDGSSMMTVQALWTAATYNIPVVYIICNNRAYRILKLNMNVYKRDILGESDPQSQYLAMDFPIPFNIAGIAEGMGIPGRNITDPEEIGPAIEEALKSGGPAVLDISIDGSVA